jgi:hypothetical protein
MEIYFINRLEYISKDAYFKACRDNTIYELYCYSNTDGKIQVMNKLTT